MFKQISRHGSSHTEHVPWKEGEQFTPTDFSSPFWGNMVVAVLWTFFLYEANDYYTKTIPKGKFHFITEFMAKYVNDGEQDKQMLKYLIHQNELKAAEWILNTDVPAYPANRTRRFMGASEMDKVSPFAKPLAPSIDPKTVVIAEVKDIE